MEKKIINLNCDDVQKCKTEKETCRKSVKESDEQETLNPGCNFEWSAIHLGAGLLDDYRRKQ